jgi:virginiamycin A acetyltransferase
VSLRYLGNRLRAYRARNRQATDLWLRDFFQQTHNVQVGLYSYGCFDRWRMPGPLRIGRYCSFAKTVRVVDANHPISALTTHPALYEKHFGVVQRDLIHSHPLIIEDDVWIGHNVVILPGCKFIGRGAIIGAGSIVTKDVGAYTISAGVPARAVRSRFPEPLIKAIEASRWWELDLAALRDLVRRNEELVYAPTVAALEAEFDL